MSIKSFSLQVINKTKDNKADFTSVAKPVVEEIVKSGCDCMYFIAKKVTIIQISNVMNNKEKTHTGKRFANGWSLLTERLVSG